MTVWVLFAGLPGTGKSTLARTLAERFSAAILDKDRVREALFSATYTDFTSEQDELCMRAMEKAAVYLTARQRVPWIFFDGRTFAASRQIEQLIHAAEQAGARWRLLHLVCEDAEAERRLCCNDPNHPAKNRAPDLYRAIQQRFEPIVRPHLLVDTTAGVASQLAAVEQYLKATGAEEPR